MKKITHIIGVSILTFLLSGCHDWLDINLNPDASTVVTPEQSLPVIVFYASQINYDHAEYGMYLSQALTTGGKSQTGSYPYKQGWEFLTINRHPQWRRHFYDIGVNVNELIKAAEKVESPNFTLIARTIRLMSTQLTTDAFGPMPRSKAYTGTSPLYDSQEEIYAWMIQEANDLIAAYDDPAILYASTNKTITKKMDRIFEGDLKKWKQFTIGLKARILLRKLPNWENSVAVCEDIINTVNQAMDGWTEPQYKYDGGTSEANCPWGKNQPVINSWESRKNLLDQAIVSEYLYVNMFGGNDRAISTLNGNSEDPRMACFLTARVGPGAPDAAVKYRCLKNNIGMGVSYKETNYPDLFTCTYTQNTGYIPLMLTEELLFIKAEALYWKNQIAESYQVTTEAVKMSMERHRLTNSVSASVFNKIYNKFFTDDKINGKYLPESTFNIGHLMRQKYVAMLFQPELWTDMRRYCYSNNTNQIKFDGEIIYPGLRRPYNLYTPYWIDNNPSSEEWVYRLNPDPETEDKYNVQELKRLGAYKNPEWLKWPLIWAEYKGDPSRKN